MSKLTPLQAATLKRFATGEIAHRCVLSYRQVDDSYFFGNMETIRRPTLEKLQASGLIEDFDRRYSGSRYRITAAGKAMAGTL